MSFFDWRSKRVWENHNGFAGTLYHYRDKSGLEWDAVIHLRNDRYGLIEMKLGGKEIDEAAKNFISIKDKINTDKWKNLRF